GVLREGPARGGVDRLVRGGFALLLLTPGIRGKLVEGRGRVAVRVVRRRDGLRRVVALEPGRVGRRKHPAVEGLRNGAAVVGRGLRRAEPVRREAALGGLLERGGRGEPGVGVRVRLLRPGRGLSGRGRVLLLGGFLAQALLVLPALLVLAVLSAFRGRGGGLRGGLAAHRVQGGKPLFKGAPVVLVPSHRHPPRARL